MVTPLRDRYPRYYPKTRKEWRRWLTRNHETSSGVWLINYKKESGRPRVPYADAVEEALCFGWIDSVMNPLDDHSFMQLFTPRKPKSNWSKLNKQRIESLIEQGLMTPAGMAKIEAAQKDGSWTSLDKVEALDVPPDLAKADVVFHHRRPLAAQVIDVHLHQERDLAGRPLPVLQRK